jgi:BirA family biotin operon repressor/biotin-[acetyl-CoA-carboxylase] ligase
MDRADLVLELLYDSRQEFVALEELSARSGLEGRRLKRALEGLGQRGHEVEPLPGRGVRLVRPVRLDAFLIERGMDRRSVAHQVICFQDVDSTNDVAFGSARRSEGALVVTAEYQRAGRGRLGRKWLSPSGSGILASVLLPASAEGLPQEALTVGAGLAVAEGIEDATALRAQVVWPNDVVWHGAKLAGVLVETRAVGGRRRAVVGFGINVTAAPSAAQAGRATTHLVQAAGRESVPERIEILRCVLVRLDEWLAALRRKRFELLHRRWLRRCAMTGQRVRVECAQVGGFRRLAGRVLDVRPLEGLVLLTDQGQILHLPAATTSVCG